MYTTNVECAIKEKNMKSLLVICSIILPSIYSKLAKIPAPPPPQKKKQKKLRNEYTCPE